QFPSGLNCRDGPPWPPLVIFPSGELGRGGYGGPPLQIRMRPWSGSPTLFKPRTIGHVFRERCDHWFTIFADRCREQHALRLIAAQLAGFEVGYHGNLATN